MNIYVGNLSRQAAEVSVRALFAQFGEVKSVKFIKDHETGDARGFAFVEMADDASGRAAIAALDSKEFENRTLKVNEARPKSSEGSRYNSFSSNYGYKDRFKTF
jgi:RNA recognition motif-containing protein